MKNRYIYSLITGIILCFFIFSSFSKAEGTCPVTLTDISSQGVLIYNTGDSSTDIKLYTSDLVNLKNEIEALGIYTDEELTDLNLHIDEVIADVSSGKRNIAEELNTKGADIDISNEKVPSWSELKGGVEPVYTNGYNTGYSAGHSDGYDEGYLVGEHDGYLDGYEAGNEDGDTAGYTRGYTKGKEDGYEEGYEEGYTAGYTKGKEDGVTIHTATYTATKRNSKIDLGQKHTYRYIDTTGVPNSNDGTYKPTTRAASIDMGATNTYRYVNTSSVPNSNSGTYKPTTRSDSIDMGATNTYRYVNTSSVPNTNSGTYTYPANSTGGKVDLGETNTYRYVNATNVYNKGKADGAITVTSQSRSATVPSGANRWYTITYTFSFAHGVLGVSAIRSGISSAYPEYNIWHGVPYLNISGNNVTIVVNGMDMAGDRIDITAQGY